MTTQGPPGWNFQSSWLKFQERVGCRVWKEVSCVGNNEEERVAKDNPGHAQKPERTNGRIGTGELDMKKHSLHSIHAV